MDTLEAKKRQRFLFMKLLYEKTHGNQYEYVDMRELGKELAFTEDQTQLIVQYLGGEDLVDEKVGGAIGITHYGVVQVESALSKPNEPTQYFPPAVNIIHIENMSHSVIQQGTHDSTQTVSFTQETMGDMQEFLKRLKNELPHLNLSEQDRSQGVADVTTIEAQLGAPRPNREIIGAAGRTLHAILLGVGGNLATDLLKYLWNSLHITL
jgi:4-alpha-glucanotransferase